MDLPKIDTAAPERIWLECCDDGSLAPFAGWNDVEEDEAQRAEYVRADLYDALKSANQELALQVLASDGQAQEALERAVKAEAEVAKLREALTKAKKCAERVSSYNFQCDAGDLPHCQDWINLMEAME